MPRRGRGSPLSQAKRGKYYPSRKGPGIATQRPHRGAKLEIPRAREGENLKKPETRARKGAKI
nr:MAG TPA: hypothetical protein [Caudoviricetes sp.]